MYGFPLFDLPFFRVIAVGTVVDVPFLLPYACVRLITFGSLAATVLVYGHLRKQLFAHFRIALQCVKSLPSDCALVGNQNGCGLFYTRDLLLKNRIFSGKDAPQPQYRHIVPGATCRSGGFGKKFSTGEMFISSTSGFSIS
ncbi:MAG: hypothetical protein MJ033_01625 [Victivallaceae bacterium]|nr:hypothetical protein [Victivallaceae bacterium]